MSPQTLEFSQIFFYTHTSRFCTHTPQGFFRQFLICLGGIAQKQTLPSLLSFFCVCEGFLKNALFEPLPSWGKVKPQNQSTPFQKVPNLSWGFTTSQAPETPLLITDNFCGTTILSWQFRSCLCYLWHAVDLQKSRSKFKMRGQIMWNWTEMHAALLNWDLAFSKLPKNSKIRNSQLGPNVQWEKPNKCS